MAEGLKRRIGLGLLTAYGVGVMVGAGIYVLIGAIVAEAGLWSPLSFLIAGVIAAPTALSYAEFSTRLPEAAGEALYVAEGTGMRWLGVLIGLAIVVAGTISAAAVLRGGAGYLTSFVAISPQIAILGLGAVLIAVAVIGVLESLALAALFTVVELAGLALVVWAGFSAPAVAELSAVPPPVWSGIAFGAVLAFFAFIGFEDIVNMAEEVKDPSHAMPRAILYSLVITSVVYALVAYAAIRSVPASELAGSERPLVLVWQAGVGGGSVAFLSLIAVAAAMNGVLAQIVMAARVLFGLGRHGGVLAVFHHSHSKFGTPVLATVMIGCFVLAGALTLPVAALAEATSTLLLSVFVIVNLSLILMKRRVPEAPFRIPMAVPVFGLAASLLALAVTFGGQS